jgi:hypothetical protein
MLPVSRCTLLYQESRFPASFVVFRPEAGGGKGDDKPGKSWYTSANRSPTRRAVVPLPGHKCCAGKQYGIAPLRFKNKFFRRQ